MRLLDRLRRVNYFAGQLLTPADLQRDQEYFRHRLRRHNRALHGYGVVSGLDVEAVQGDGRTVTITVAPGFALGPEGDEIVVAERVSLALPTGGTHWVVAARYDERLVEPLPAATLGTGDQRVQFEATEETSVVEVLVALPDDPDSPWVTLAELHRAHGGNIRVDEGRRRRATAL
jgi:hypothetical protein